MTAMRLQGAGTDRARLLGACPLFRRLTPDALRAAAACARTRSAGPGDVFFRRGARASGVYVLVRGRLALRGAASRSGRVILRFVCPMDPFGLDAAVTAGRYLASAEACEANEALVWPAPAFLRLMNDHPAVAVNAVRYLAGSIRAIRGRLDALLARPLEQCLASALLGLGACTGRSLEGGMRVEIRLDHRDLAAFVGASEYSISRIISRWRRRRLVDVARGRVVIRRQQVAAIAAGGSPHARGERSNGCSAERASITAAH
jgi:CRP-like cAMP-binding protein